MSETTYTGPIKHIVVVMLENRSYDNLLGGLYDVNNAPPFNAAPEYQAGLNGLGTGAYKNPNPSDPSKTIPVANQTTTTSPGSYPPTTIPNVDPGEFFRDMAQQFLGGSRPKSNPWGDTPTPTMQGFTQNFADYGGVAAGGPPTTANVKDVMNYFSPAQVPTTSMLANKYAVCDTWFASVPTQTFANRAFSICANPGIRAHSIESGFYSLIDDSQYMKIGIPPTKPEDLFETPSLFSVLDSVGPAASGANWKVYFHDYSISQLVAPYVTATAAGPGNVNVATYDDTDWPSTSMPPWMGSRPTTFDDDVKQQNGGALPPFVLIEPRYSNSYPGMASGLSPNSNHPGPEKYPLTSSDTNDPIDVENGELFLRDVYTKLKNSPYWDSTLLIVTYDEPGGIFDHVEPPTATKPGTIVNTPSDGPPSVPCVGDDGLGDGDKFAFNVYGGRVPTIIASPYIAPSTTIPPAAAPPTSPTSPPTLPFDHTSIIKTAWDIFNLAKATGGQSALNERDAAAASLVPYLCPTIVND